MIDFNIITYNKFVQRSICVIMTTVNKEDKYGFDPILRDPVVSHFTVDSHSSKDNVWINNVVSPMVDPGMALDLSDLDYGFIQLNNKRAKAKACELGSFVLTTANKFECHAFSTGSDISDGPGFDCGLDCLIPDDHGVANQLIIVTDCYDFCVVNGSLDKDLKRNSYLLSNVCNSEIDNLLAYCSYSSMRGRRWKSVAGSGSV